METDRIFVVVGLGYGDEGKGTVTDYLARRYKARYVFRFNGGAQASHFVVTPDGMLHCFSQFGSGTLAGAETILTNKMLVDPIRMMNEATVLQEKGVANPLNLVVIDPDCLVITPFHGIINQMLEISRGGARHGSCGVGVGETVKDGRQFGKMALIARDMFDKEMLWQKLDFFLRIKIDLAEQLVDEHSDKPELAGYLKKLRQKDYVKKLVSVYCGCATESGHLIKHIDYSLLACKGNIIFEGAQGVLLDEERGFYPYITRSCTTFKNADEWIGRFRGLKKIVKIGVMRAYFTRHGKGPFVTEDDWLGTKIPDIHNGTNDWQGVFRIGWFDLVIARYALESVGKINCVALTNFDRLNNFEEIKVCYAYKYIGTMNESMDQFFECEVRENGDIIIKKIKFPLTTSLERQNQLAELLKLCEPIYCSVEKNKFVQFLEEELKIKISIISVGPKATEKIEARPLC